MECTVRVEVFEGPMDLLLHLIKKNEIDIHDIPVALITQQYLEYLGLMRSLNLDIASEYLVMAATLVHIKSRMLLPTPSEEQEGEDEELEDPRAELVRRLLEYRRYKEMGEELGEREILERDVFVHPDELPKEDDEGYPLLREINIFQLLESFRRVLAARRWDEIGLEVDLDRVSLADRIREISEILEDRQEGMVFEELLSSAWTRMDLVITLLALLEMIRMRMIRAYQAAAYGAIRIALVPPHAASEELHEDLRE
jgi:segregation and condensation protein A